MSEHLHPGLVAVTAGPVDSAGRREFSSGRLITPTLVLTSRHGVVLAGGEHRPGIEVRLVLGARGGVRPGDPVTCTVAWAGTDDLDAALLRLHPAPDWQPPDGFLPALRVAEPAGRLPVPVTVTGMSAAAARSTGNSTETETVRGSIDPLTYTGSDRYAIDLRTGWPTGWDEWSGMSGSAVLDDAQSLIGVVAWSDRAYAGRRLTAVPLRALLADRGFQAVLRDDVGDVPRLAPSGADRPGEGPHGAGVPSGPRPAATRPALGSALYTLKAPPRAIVDRRAELSSLPTLIREGRSGRPELMHAIVGMAGVGKSALARHLAHRFAADFPDCQFELDLYGHTPDQEPLDTEAALEVLLSWAGIGTDHAPTLDVKAALWRDWLRGRRALLLLDNAGSLDQVAGLLPGYGDCLVLITSRNVLHDPERITLTELDTLPEPDAVRLLVSGAGLPEEEAADPALAQVCRMCGYLPLAVQAVAVRLRFEDPADLLAAMREAESPLLDIPDADTRVGSAFTVSYEALRTTDPAQAALLRTVALQPGPDLGADLCAAISGLPPREVRRRLADLADRHLLQRLGGGRFGFHDLFLAYARSQALTEESAERWGDVLSRTFEHMQTRGEAAHRVLATGTAAEGSGFGSTGEARGWLEAERANLVAVTLAAIDRGSPRARGLADLSHTLLGWLGMTTELGRMWLALKDAAQRSDDRPAQADAHRGLGDVRRRQGRYADAQDNYRQAEEIYQELDDPHGQARALWGLGDIRRMRGQYADAGAVFERVRRMYEELGDRHGCAEALWGLGNVGLSLGHYEEASEAFGRAERIHDELGDRRGRAEALRGRADARRLTERHAEARTGYQQALELYTEIGDRRGQAQSLRGLGHLDRLEARYAEAGEKFTVAHELSREIGDRRGEADMLRGLGDVQRMLGEYDAAREAFTRASAVLRETGNRGGQAYALRGLGDTERMAGRYADARAAYAQARGIFEEIGLRRGLATALQGLGELALTRGSGTSDPAEAREAFGAALRIYEEIGAEASAAQCRERLAGLAAEPS
ncbi:tetratricopeptide repeat protein [Streptomyces sp. NPDC002004]